LRVERGHARERYNPPVRLSAGALIAACGALVAVLLWLPPDPPAQAARPGIDAVSPEESDGGMDDVELRSVESPDIGALRASAELPPEPAPPEPDGLEDGELPEAIEQPGEQPADSP
jgi:hypothetical protein